MLSKIQKRKLFLAAGVLYAAASIGHAVMQRRYALHSKNMETSSTRRTDLPTLDVIIPVHNEVPERLYETLQSIDGQYPSDKLNVYLVDDGSKNRHHLDPIYDKYRGRPGWHILLLEENVGKRRAQDAAFQISNGEMFLTGDGDSPFLPDSFLPMVTRMREDDRVGAVAGKVSVANKNKNWLTRLLAERYRQMFELERAAQGKFGAVWTCTGPISLYRRSLLEPLWSDYLNQTYKGSLCLSGDDLQLTNLVIATGFQAVYESKAEARTYVPETLREYWSQQTRWNRSMFRDQCPTIRSSIYRSRCSGNWFPLVDTLVRTYFPLLLVFPPALSIVHALKRTSARDGMAVMLSMLSVRAIITYWNSKPELVSRARYTVVYGAIHVFALVPGRIRAYLTRGNSNWVTRL
jgi:cellulose synthase/poly-beta-1,6-N-acetylglucosamine synthase-like glycosyltransferase